MNGQPVNFSYHPTPDDFVWTEGSAASKATVQPGTLLELFTEDCLGGAGRWGEAPRGDGRRVQLRQVTGTPQAAPGE